MPHGSMPAQLCHANFPGFVCQLHHRLQAGYWAVNHLSPTLGGRVHPLQRSPVCCRIVLLKKGLVGPETLIMHYATQRKAGWSGAGAAGIGLAAALAGVNVAVSILINQYFHALFRIALQLKVPPASGPMVRWLCEWGQGRSMSYRRWQHWDRDDMGPSLSPKIGNDW